MTQTNRRILWLIGLLLPYTLIACSLIEYTLWILSAEFDPSRDPVIRKEYAGSLIPTILCLALYESVYYFRQLQVALLEAEQLKKENLQSQLEMLKNQVNPHFLFNSLNTLSAIIPDDAEPTVEFVQRLSKVYRYILEIREMQTVSLRDELPALRAYTKASRA